MKIAYLGPEGTFGWRIATRDNPGATLIPCRSHAKVIEAVREGKAELGYMARENSQGGTVVDTVDPLIKNYVGITMALVDNAVFSSQGDLMICGETVLPIEQCLYGWEKDPQPVQRIYSHPQALTQCEEYIGKRFPTATFIPANSTISGLEQLHEDKASIAIAPPWAGEFYPDVPLLERAIQDSRVNYTRFLVIGKDDCMPTGQDKTSLWFTVPGDEESGTFDNVSQQLALAKINKTVIETRPRKTELGKYVFLVDVDAHRRDRIIKLALELTVLAGHTTILTVLGSYPRWQNGL